MNKEQAIEAARIAKRHEIDHCGPGRAGLLIRPMPKESGDGWEVFVGFEYFKHRGWCGFGQSHDTALGVICGWHILLAIGEHMARVEAMTDEEREEHLRELERSKQRSRSEQTRSLASQAA